MIEGERREACGMATWSKVFLTLIAIGLAGVIAYQAGFLVGSS